MVAWPCSLTALRNVSKVKAASETAPETPFVRPSAMIVAEEVPAVTAESATLSTIPSKELVPVSPVRLSLSV